MGVVLAVAGCSGDRGEPLPPQKVVEVAVPAVAPPTSPPPAPAPAPAPPAPTHAFLDDDLDPVDVVTDKRPTPKQVAAMIARLYEPSRLVLSPRQLDPQLVAWTWTFDGIPVLTEAKSSTDNGRWITRFRREAAGPEPVKRASLLAPAEARRRARFATPPRGKEDAVTLIYDPEFGRRQVRWTTGTNAADFRSVIERYHLVYLVERDPEYVFLDAYTGAERRRASSVVQ